MKKYGSKLKDFGFLLWRWVNPIIDPFRLIGAIPGYFFFFRDWNRYSRLKDSEKIRLGNVYPCIHDKTETTKFPSHYFYQDIWAFKSIYESGTDYHVDVGSRIDFIGFLTAITKVTFIDIRPLVAELENLNSKKGSILTMPYENNSVQSLSCLHVAEHIGLGRYGDPLDVFGTQKACKELSRILALGGKLYFSLPIGKPVLCFNAHRVHSPQQIIDYFSDLKLIELSGIDDQENFKRNINISILESSNYACGLFLFTKK
jgi:SAM-dependent methyltransferase